MSLNLASLSSSSTISVTSDNELNVPLSSNASSHFTTSFMVKKDLVLSPLTRIARGMQSLGLNLRNTGHNEVVHDAAFEKRKQQTRSRIIEI